MPKLFFSVLLEKQVFGSSDRKIKGRQCLGCLKQRFYTVRSQTLEKISRLIAVSVDISPQCDEVRLVFTSHVRH